MGGTVKRPRNVARLVVTFEVKFPIKELPGSMDAVDLLRKLLEEDGGQTAVFEDLIGEYIDYGGKVTDVKLEATK